MIKVDASPSIRDAFSFAWTTLIRDPLFFIKALLLIILVHGVIAFLETFVIDEDPILSSLLFSLGLIFQGIVTLGLIKISLSFYHQQEPKISQLFSPYLLFPSFLVATVLYSLLFFIGFILFIIPGMIIGVRLAFFAHSMVDEELGIIDSLKRSYALTKGHEIKILLLLIILFIINMAVSIIALILVFIVLPITLLTTSFYYRTLLPSETTYLKEKAST